MLNLKSPSLFKVLRSLARNTSKPNNGMKRGGHLHLRAYSRSGFLKDLLESSGVICNAGFELPSEALHLGKKILIKPLSGQLEQLSNALAISSLKLGLVMKRLKKACVEQFLERPSILPIKYPNVARIIVDWIEGGLWEDLLVTAELAWKKTGWMGKSGVTGFT